MIYDKSYLFTSNPVNLDSFEILEDWDVLYIYVLNIYIYIHIHAGTLSKSHKIGYTEYQEDKINTSVQESRFYSNFTKNKNFSFF